MVASTPPRQRPSSAWSPVSPLPAADALDTADQNPVQYPANRRQPTTMRGFLAVDIRPSRRDVLKSGVLAGAGLATGLSPMALVRALATGGPTCGQLSDIEHVIVLVQENRSFDHYFGRYK